MRKHRLLLAFLLFLAGILFVYFQFRQENVAPIQKRGEVKQKEDSEKTPVPITQTSLFVPSWTLDDSPLPGNYDRFIYFGVTGTASGIEIEDEGYQSLANFLEAVPEGSKKLLTVKMTNSSTNLAVLKNKEAQRMIINESIKIARDNKFDGLVLDFELFSLFNESSTQINSFVADFYGPVKQNNLSFALTIYGDVFYRKRPYDLDFLGKNSDEIMIMAYDFHKSIGEPGPNFPLSGKEKYGYDMEVMLDDYTAKVSPEKLTVLFGMYGYDWAVDEKKRPLRQATALSLNQIRSKYLETCGKTNCVPFRDEKAKENEINYVDGGSLYHIIWFEDEESVKEKSEIIKQNGVGSIGYWASGYF